MIHTSRCVVITALVVATVVLTVTPVPAQDEPVRQRFTARAMAMGTSNPPILPRGRTATVDINISRWTTNEEMDALFGELVEDGQPALVRALNAQDETGWIRVTGSNQTSTLR